MNATLHSESGFLSSVKTGGGVSGTKIPEGESVIVLDAGGTNFRTCLVTFNNGVAEISDFQKMGMPGAKEEVSAKEFFSILADSIERFMGKSKKIGFCCFFLIHIAIDQGMPNKSLF